LPMSNLRFRRRKNLEYRGMTEVETPYDFHSTAVTKPPYLYLCDLSLEIVGVL
jgi:hypothetical protein